MADMRAMATDTAGSGNEKSRRIIKRYSNRKLYDTRDSRYVTLAQIAELVRGGEEVQVIDNASKEDKTEATLALIISEEVKSRPRSATQITSSLRDKFLAQLRETPLARFITEGEAEAPAPEVPPMPPEPPKSGDVASKNRLQELVDSSKRTIDDWQAAIDERVRALFPASLRDLQGEVKRLSQRIDELEQRLAAAEKRGRE